MNIFRLSSFIFFLRIQFDQTFSKYTDIILYFEKIKNRVKDKENKDLHSYSLN